VLQHPARVEQQQLEQLVLRARELDELVAHDRSEEEIQQILGCDWLIYQDLKDLQEAVSGPKQRIDHFDSSCFDGEYVTGIEPGYFERIRQLRSDEAKKTRRAS